MGRICLENETGSAARNSGEAPAIRSAQPNDTAAYRTATWILIIEQRSSDAEGVQKAASWGARFSKRMLEAEI
jgi:hypothetical protein